MKAETLEDLDFSVRTYNCLARVGVKTLADLSTKTINELKQVRNLGRKKLRRSYSDS